MTTAIIILAVALIALSVAAAVIIFRYMRKSTEVNQLEEDLMLLQSSLQKKSNDLERWEATLKDQCRRQREHDEKREHIFANFEVLDSEDSKPTKKAIGKSLSSKVGYAVRKKFPEIKERHDGAKGGRTVYSVDIYVTPYDI